MSKKTIVVKSSIVVKKSSELRKVKYKATAGLSEAEVIERHTIGEYEEEQDKHNDSRDSTKSQN